MKVYPLLGVTGLEFTTLVFLAEVVRVDRFWVWSVTNYKV